MPPATRSTTNRKKRLLADPYSIPSSTTPLTPPKTPRRPRTRDGSKDKNKVKHPDPEVKMTDLNNEVRTQNEMKELNVTKDLHKANIAAAANLEVNDLS
jgi:hypothetical protein